MTYDHELTLIGHPVINKDEVGNQVPGDPIEVTILCGLQSVGRNEFYNAATYGMRPELIFTVHAYEYEGQQILRFEGKKYKVLRTYSTSFEEMELTCERVNGQ